jgi:CBS domain-containing protein
VNVRDLMCFPVHTCHATDACDSAARLMWEHDCGSVPVVDEDNQVLGVITDRDICMAAYTQGLPLREIPVKSAMSSDVFSCSALDTLETATSIMREHQVRRLPVLDDKHRLAGILSLNDIALTALDSLGAEESPIRAQDVVVLLGTVSEPRTDRHGADGRSRGEQDGFQTSQTGAGERAGRGSESRSEGRSQRAQQAGGRERESQAGGGRERESQAGGGRERESQAGGGERRGGSSPYSSRHKGS